MKTKFIKAIYLMSGFLMLGTIGCQNEDVAGEQHSHLDIEIKRKSFGQFPKLSALVRKTLPTNFGQIEDLGRNTTDSLYHFDIDSTSVTEIVKDGRTFYTMEIHRENQMDDNFENLVIEEGATHTRAYLMKYYPTERYLDDLTTNVHAQYSGGVAMTELNYETLMSRGGNCTTVTFAFCGNGPRGTLAGPGCYDNHDGGAHVFTVSYEFCDEGDLEHVVKIISPESDNPSSGPGGGQAGDDNSGSGTLPIDDEITPNPADPIRNLGPGSIVTEPVFNVSAVKAFEKSLTAEQRDWWQDPENAAEVNALISELNANGSVEGMAFVEGMMDSMMHNDGYSGDSELGDSDEDNDAYEGPMRRIPSTIILEDGSEVSVTFGNTKDGVNSDREVADDVVNAIIHALNEANEDLPASEKITSIHIAATTNGEHAAESNHKKGTAVDISKINGTRLIHLGPNSQVTALQNGFQSFHNIRENFGPVFKFKTFSNGNVHSNWPVGGHKDHIHISVQLN